jgi:acyl-CoA synthetase (NDP forming)
MERIFQPRSIVVIGVSERPDNLARHIVANLQAFEYAGELYAVGRREGNVGGVPILDSIDLVPDGIDLAVILTPAAIVPDMVDRLGRKGVKRLVVESGGFREFSKEGRELEEELIRIVQRWDMRLVGPNCISVLNLDAGVCLPFAPISPQAIFKGPVSVISQSGGISLDYLYRLCNEGLGVSKVISIGNKIDLDEVDFLEYLLEDPNTKIVCMYLESIEDGRQLMDLARNGTKPIIVHKANRGVAGQKVAFSHTAALANDDQVVSAAFNQVGILRADSFRDMAAIAQGLALPAIHGDKILILSRSGGHAVTAADAAEHNGFRLIELSDGFLDSVRESFPTDVISLTNPIDLGAVYDLDLYGDVIEKSLEAFAPDAVLFVLTYGQAEAEPARRLAQRLEDIARNADLPIAFCAFTHDENVDDLRNLLNMPLFTEIEDALRGLAASRRWHAWRSRQKMFESKQTVPLSMHDPPTGLRSGVLSTDVALDLCEAYGIPGVPREVIEDKEGARPAVERLGLPVAVKLITRDLTHKSDVGGVVLDLHDAHAVETTVAEMFDRARGLSEGGHSSALMLQQMVQEGVEVIIGGKQDQSFGPVLMFGFGGIYVEILADVAFRIAPIHPDDVVSMLEEVRGSELFKGVRGQAAVDREALIGALVSFSNLMLDHPSLIEFEINPLIVTRAGVVAVDARGVVKT